MIFAEDAAPPAPSPLRTIIPVITILGILTYLVFSLTTGMDQSTFIQVGAAMALLVYVITFVDIMLGIAVLIACIAMSPEMSLGGVGNLRLEDFVVPALLVAWFTRSAGKHEPMAPSLITGPGWLYLGLGAFSSLLAIALFDVNPRTSTLMMAKNIEYFLLFLIIVNNVKTEGEFKALVVFMLLASAAGAFVGADRAIGEKGSLEAGRLHGPTGETANIFGGFLILNLSVAVGLYLHSTTHVQRIAFGAAAGILAIALMYTYSRTSWAALAGGMGVFAFWKHRRLLIILFIGIVAFSLLAPDSILQRATTITTVITHEGPESWQARVAAWADALRKITQYPLFGQGMGATNLGDVDNEYFRVGVDLGIAGLVAFLWLLIRIGRKANAAYDALAPLTFAKGYAAGFQIAFFSLIIHAVGATSLTSIRTMECFMLLTGLMVCLHNNMEKWKLELHPSRAEGAAFPAGRLAQPV